MQLDDVEELTTLLATLRREGRQQSGLEPRLVPVDEAAAYRIAGLVAERLGWERGGWKIAANKPQMQRALRTTAPIYGCVYSRFIFQSPVSLETSSLLHPIAECEYVVRLANDLPPRDAAYSAEEVEGAIGALHAAVEVAECRFRHDDRFPPLPAILADGSGAGSLVLSPEIDGWKAREIGSQPVILYVDGAEKRRGTAAEAIEHPLVPATWLANALSRAGIGLRSGEFISTGTCTGMVLAQSGEEHLADFGPLGQVSISFR